MSRWMKRLGGALVVAVLVLAGCDPGLDNPHIEKSGPVPPTTAAPATTESVAPTVPGTTGAPVVGSTATLHFYRVSDARLQAWQGAECCIEHSVPGQPAGQHFSTHDVVCVQPAPAGCAEITGLVKAQYDEGTKGTRITVATALGGAPPPVSGLSDSRGEDVDVGGHPGVYRVQPKKGNEFATLDWDAGGGVAVQISVFLFYTTKAELLDLASQLVLDETTQMLPVAASAATTTTT